MARNQIRCINKSDRTSPHERIVNVGGSWGKISAYEAIRRIKGGIDSFYVVDRNRNEAEVVVRQTSNRDDFLTTEADGSTQNNLLSLPECP